MVIGDGVCFIEILRKHIYFLSQNISIIFNIQTCVINSVIRLLEWCWFAMFQRRKKMSPLLHELWQVFSKLYLCHTEDSVRESVRVLCF